MKNYLLLFLGINITYCCQAQDYRLMSKLILDSLYHCIKSDSIIDELEKIKFKKSFVVKDKYIAKKLDSALFEISSPFTKADLIKILGSKILVSQEDSLFFKIYGGYILFGISLNPAGECYITFNSRKGMSKRGRKNKMRINCEIKGGIDYFFNYVYAYKYLSPSLCYNQLQYSQFFVYIMKKNILVPEHLKELRKGIKY
jgi:hypothetical protein